jgi:hypothetical protein
MAIDVVKQVVGEFGLVYRLEAFQHWIHRHRDGAGSETGLDPTVKAVGRELPLYHCRGLEKNSWRFHTTSEHFLRLSEEVEVVGSGVGHRQVERIAVTAARASDALEVARLGRWYRAEDKGREVSNVDAHLQCRRTGEQIGEPWFSVFDVSLELPLQLLTGPALEQAGVLSCKDTLDIARGIEAPVVVALNLKALVSTWAVVSKAR